MTCELWLDFVYDLSAPMLRGDASVVGMVVRGIQAFIKALSHQGSARAEDDAALQAVATAICSTSTDMTGKKAAFQRFFGLSSRRINQAIQLNTKDGSRHFKKVQRKPYAGCVGHRPVALGLDPILLYLHEPINRNMRHLASWGLIPTPNRLQRRP